MPEDVVRFATVVTTELSGKGLWQHRSGSGFGDLPGKQIDDRVVGLRRASVTGDQPTGTLCVCDLGAPG